MASTTMLFLNSKGTMFTFLNMKHISNTIGIDVTSYKFRKLICTWALSHPNKLVREAEAPALNHKPDVAENVYRENRAIKPQLLVQQYNVEEEVISSQMKDDLQHLDPEVKKLIDDMRAEQEVRQQREMVEDRKRLEKQHLDYKHLGPFHRVSVENKRRIQTELKNLGIEVYDWVQTLSKSKFRHKLVREICQPEAKELRNLWKVG